MKPATSNRMEHTNRFMIAALGLLMGLPVTPLFSQAAQTKPMAIAPAPADPAIAAALAKISPVQIRADIAKLVSFRTRLTIGSMDKELAPGEGVTAAADWVAAEFQRISVECGGCLEVKRDDYIEPASAAGNSRVKQPTRVQNIYAVMRGSDPEQADRRVLVTGHYDTRATDVMDTKVSAPGANDDSSGVAVSLESARVLSKLKFPSTIVFVAVAGEEQGLIGSRHLAKVAKAEGWDLQEVLNDDIVGGDTTPGQEKFEDKNVVRVFSEGVPANATLEQLHQIQTLGGESDSSSRELARAIAEVDKSYFKPVAGKPAFHPVLVFRRDRFLRGGDHSSFNNEGFAAVRFTEWRENYDHQHNTPRTENGVKYGDFIEYVDMDYVARVARLNAASLATFASAPGKPEDVKVATGGLDNDTELLWKAPKGAPADTSYEVVWRTTESPLWQTVVKVTGTDCKLPEFSKDNVIFGVRSVDAKGHRSPAVFPMPDPLAGVKPGKKPYAPPPLK
ncbi:M28 family metallopeptidase [Granulicella sp. WH15]|uniref:M28 family metallopeptidase n=1 Tax=Granulicella sp. WH15 TaxID=2602070 RepID=UPI002107A1C0|nr:M28 family metallopeptidase [Granulicella sp. WH15]